MQSSFSPLRIRTSVPISSNETEASCSSAGRSTVFNRFQFSLFFVSRSHPSPLQVGLAQAPVGCATSTMPDPTSPQLTPGIFTL